MKRLSLDDIRVSSFVTKAVSEGVKFVGGITGGCQVTDGPVCGPWTVETEGLGCPVTEVGCSGTCTRGD